MEKIYEHIRVDFDGFARLIIRREECGEEKAVVYTDLPTLKEELRENEEQYPDLVEILVDDHEEGDDPLADTGMMQAVVRATEERWILFGMNPESGHFGVYMGKREYW